MNQLSSYRSVLKNSYIAGLNAQVAANEARRAEQERADSEAARRATLAPLEVRLGRLLASIPDEVQREGLSLPSLQASLRGRRGGNCHPGELAAALRKIGYTRSRRWCADTPFQALWRKQE